MCHHEDYCGGCSCHLGHAPCTHCERHSMRLRQHEVDMILYFIEVFYKLRIISNRDWITITSDMVDCWENK